MPLLSRPAPVDDLAAARLAALTVPGGTPAGARGGPPGAAKDVAPGVDADPAPAQSQGSEVSLERSWAPRLPLTSRPAVAPAPSGAAAPPRTSTAAAPTPGAKAAAADPQPDRPRGTAPAGPHAHQRVVGGWVPPPLPGAAPLPDPDELEVAVTGPVDHTAPADADAEPTAAHDPPQPPSPLDRWRGARLDPGRRGVVVLALVALAAAALAGVVLLRSHPHEVSAPPVVQPGAAVPGSDAAPSPPAATGAPSPASAEVVVAVAGKVVHPGLLRLPAGSRVDDAVRAAGGASEGADLTGLNLARRLVDGEQVLVGVPQPVAAVPPAGVPPGASAGAASVVDLNAATVADLDGLPGIGPVLAQHVVDWRTEHGRFASVDQLREVPGIGESKYAQLKAKVRV